MSLKKSKGKGPMGIFERFLSLWFALSMGLGVVLGQWIPSFFIGLSLFQFHQVNLMVAVLIWMMVYPMMLQVDWKGLLEVREQPRGLVLTLTINWLVKPFTMAALGWFFFNHLFSSWMTPTEAQQYLAGLILLGVAPCTAMVFVWSQLTQGCPTYTLAQVALNDLILVFAFAPLAGLLLGITQVQVPWSTLFLSVVLYVVVPLVASEVTKKLLRPSQKVEKLIHGCKPFSMLGLLLTVVLLFGFQAQTLLNQPLVMGLIAVPLLIQSYGIFAIAYYWAWKCRIPHSIAAPASLIGTSNFFELAVAVAIGLFGIESGAALATVVGVLVEVPVMLSLVAFANQTRSYFPPSSTSPPFS